MVESEETPARYDVVVLGGGYAGVMAALRLHRKKLRVALVNSRDAFVERVRLQEAIVGEVKPRIASLTALFAGTSVDFICGEVEALAAMERRVRVRTRAGLCVLAFEKVIYALGSWVDAESMPGVAEHAYRLDPGEGPRSAGALRRALEAQAGQALRVLSVGGGASAIEAAGEIKSAWPACDVTILSQKRAGDFKGPEVEAAVRAELKRLGVRLLDDHAVKAVSAKAVVIERGEQIPFDLCVWSAGMRTPSIAAHAGVTCDHLGRVQVDPNMRSLSHPGIFAAGDAALPLAPTGAPYRASVLVATITGAYVADAVLAAMRGDTAFAPFSYSTLAQGIAVGRLGVLFPLDRDDRQVGFVLRGRTARVLRNFIIWATSYFIKLERLAPGFTTWPGQRRVGLAEARAATNIAATPEVSP